ncbi:MAG: hypothetical protein ABW092_10870 [Candidatus Thiodiazotropha sp.]
MQIKNRLNIMLNKLITLVFVLTASYSPYLYACQSPEGEWLNRDKYGESKLIFSSDGTGKFYPDAELKDFEKIAWRFISETKRDNTEPREYPVETNVIKVDYNPPTGPTEYLLCTGNKIVGQVYSDGDFLVYQFIGVYMNASRV